MPTSTEQQGIFPTLLASSVHDIKNSLTTVHELINKISNELDEKENQNIIQLEFEANRMNNILVQLLELFKIDCDKFSLNVDEHSIADILQEVEAQQTPLLNSNKIELSLNFSEDLYCYCDYTHICNALGSIINNAQRYTQSKISLSAYQEQQLTVFCMEDDGEGYPEQIIDSNTHNILQCTGSTGLGLYFVSAIADLHRSKNKNGFIKLDNNSTLGGARFRLFLP